jgi:hypothetical protein
MVGMVFLVFFGLMSLMWFSWRAAKKREENGEKFAPPGKLRWSDRDPPQ